MKESESQSGKTATRDRVLEGFPYACRSSDLELSLSEMVIAVAVEWIEWRG